MFDEKIKEIKANIDDLNSQITNKTAEAKAALEADNLEKARTIRAEIDGAKSELETAKNDLALFESMKNEGGAEKVAAKTTEVQSEELTYRDKVEAFIRTKGGTVNEGLRFGETRDEVLIPMNDITPTTDGVKREHTKPVTSEEIITTPLREVKTVVDLKQFTSIHKATKGTGKYPILRRATSKLVSVAELEKNPALAKPDFKDVAWEVKTYRGAIPVSQESIDDADVDLLGIIAENAGQIKTNTTNAAIADIMKTFEAKAADDIDDIKAVLNVALDPAYNVSFVVSQSFYQALDTAKDKDGRYLFQDSIISASGKVLFGKPVFVVADEVLGSAGEAKAFVGDVNRAILFVDRKDLGLRWADNEIYGQYLQAVVRFDVKKADEKAGYFVTFTPSEA
ncbi:phage major capsid protein [Streptococcus dysgalactiae subsp. equisimilis]|uniref:phage major capsid protein n=1 Tax=Streptococcus dysgalactiae TaxID=1334 RepID=UPI000DA2FEF1|nr:phage major capsid protein [Streptococcus dysgalactiae]HEP5559293.1 phage major capsid protein [Streptococcus pyogenes]MBM6541653.1 phage major capsid protein [Streptococcus dysgalactiae subsp. equisimilis]MCY7218512.1 phage major capsid protein [Streptococcus dysgalactiae]MCY7228375.1 phage major capsid protein [Streptococcus dysgalactiae]SQF68613.1 phage major capsid protein [Streptococcus dysgalactiae subsp. equisimilis]